MTRTAVIVPAYNEVETLGATLSELRSLWPDLDIVVVDDGSTDGTAEVAVASGVVCLSLPFNLGIGGALRLGFRYVVDRGYVRALQFDADGQHDPHEIPALLAALDDGADLVVGSRFAGAGTYRVSLGRRVAMAMLRLVTRRLSGRRFTDTSSGFRGFSRAMLERFASDYPLEYLDSVEALVVACRAGFDVREVPVHMRERAGGRASNRKLRLIYHYIRLLVVLGSSPRPRPKPATGGEARP